SPLRHRQMSASANTTSALPPKASRNPGCQRRSQLELAVTLNSRAGSASQTTKRFSSAAACGPSRLVRRQREPRRIRAKTGRTMVTTENMDFYTDGEAGSLLERRRNRQAGSGALRWAIALLGLLSLAGGVSARDYRFSDAHVHYLDFFQESDGMEELFKAMDAAGVDHVMLAGIPVAKKWHEDE